MSSKLEVYKAYYEASRANPPASLVEANETYLSDDFQLLDKDGNSQMDKQAYIGMTHLLSAAFKDFRAVYSDLREEGDDVIVSYHFEGTHTGDFDLSAMGLGVLPASGKKIVWPEESSEFKIKGDKIVSIKPHGDAGGMEAFLGARGMTPPSA
jgi:predicted ester cyclase